MSGVGALYVHVPFCARKCAYCDFVSEACAGGDPRLDAYLDETLRQLDAFAATGLLGDCVTAYVGGGTPTVLGAARLGRLVGALREACPRVGELTCEANPDSLTDDVLEALVAAGATRLSVGVQSLADDELCALGRLHDAACARERVSAAVATGLRVSVDLMCAIEHQTDASWDATIEGVLSLGVGHVSVYPLAIEEDTPLGRRFGGETPAFNDEDVQAERMERAAELLARAGYCRYEVASYARPGQECAHNVAYWTGVPYLGLGLGAASMLEPAQYELARGVYGWLPEPDAGAARMRFSTYDREVEFLSEREAWAEDLMLGMRLVRGVDAARVPADAAHDLARRGLVELRGGRLVPTHDGWLLGNELFAALWDLRDECSPR